MSAHRKLLLPCNCAGTCSILAVDDWGDMDKYPNDPHAWSFEFYSRAGSGVANLRWRLKTAFAVLFGRNYVLDCVSLDGHGIRQLRAFIDENPAVRLDSTSTSWTVTGVPTTTETA